MKTTIFYAICMPIALFVAFTQRVSAQDLDKSRFEVLTNFNNKAVRDLETGLIWERSPALTPLNWDTAVSHCNSLAVSGRRGWRLPTIQELSNLLDQTDLSNVWLPAGHPFDIPKEGPPGFGRPTSSTWWTSSERGREAWCVSFSRASPVGGCGKSPAKSEVRAWCVR
jgi:hypothetical protein